MDPPSSELANTSEQDAPASEKDPAPAQAGSVTVTAPKPAPYKDRVISAAQLQTLPPDEDDPANTDFSGPPRSLRVELGLSRNERGPVHYDEIGVNASGFWESERWGGFSLDGGVFHSDNARTPEGDNAGLGGTLTLWQRDLAIDGNWRLDNGLGVLNSPVLPLQRAQYRFFLPSVPLAGISTEWRDAARGTQLQAAFGRAGAYTGTRAVGFDAADGHVASLGAQWQWAPGWNGAAAYLTTVGRIVPGSLGEPTLQPGNTRALHVATGWKGGHDSLQFNLLGSDGDRGGAEGAWIDGESLRGRYLHNYGVFRLEPELAWGAYPIQNDVEGVYYRTAYQYGRWSWSAGADALQPLSDLGEATQYATGYLRYQATSTMG